jgi:hypothetical protein
MSTTPARLIRVQIEWNGWRSAEVPLSELEDLHWFRPHDAPQRLLYGYVSCESLMNGTVPHDCDRVSGPHRLHVCVLKKHVVPSAYAEMARRADARREAPPWRGVRLSRGA